MVLLPAPLDQAAVENLGRELLTLGVDAIAVCFLQDLGGIKK